MTPIVNHNQFWIEKIVSYSDENKLKAKLETKAFVIICRLRIIFNILASNDINISNQPNLSEELLEKYCSAVKFTGVFHMLEKYNPEIAIMAGSFSIALKNKNRMLILKLLEIGYTPKLRELDSMFHHGWDDVVFAVLQKLPQEEIKTLKSNQNLINRYFCNASSMGLKLSALKLIELGTSIFNGINGGLYCALENNHKELFIELIKIEMPNFEKSRATNEKLNGEIEALFKFAASRQYEDILSFLESQFAGYGICVKEECLHSDQDMDFIDEMELYRFAKYVNKPTKTRNRLTECDRLERAVKFNDLMTLHTLLPANKHMIPALLKIAYLQSNRNTHIAMILIEEMVASTEFSLEQISLTMHDAIRTKMIDVVSYILEKKVLDGSVCVSQYPLKTSLDTVSNSQYLLTAYDHGCMEIAQLLIASGMKPTDGLINRLEFTLKEGNGNAKMVRMFLASLSKNQIDQIFVNIFLPERLFTSDIDWKLTKEFAQIYLESGVDPFRVLYYKSRSFQYREPYSIFSFAVSKGWLEVVTACMENFHLIEDKSTILIDNYSCASEALENGYDEILLLLLQNGYSLENCRLNVLYLIASKGLIHTFHKFKNDTEPKLFAEMINRHQLLKVACMNGHDDLAELLVQSGANILKKTEEKKTCYELAVSKKLIKTQQAILQQLVDYYESGMVYDQTEKIVYPEIFLSQTLLDREINPRAVTVIFKEESEVFYVNPKLLAKHSPFFETLFDNKFSQDGGVIINDARPEDFRFILLYLLNGYVDFPHHVVKGLISLSDQFILPRLQYELEEWILDHPECENWMDKLTLFKRSNDPQESPYPIASSSSSC